MPVIEFCEQLELDFTLKASLFLQVLLGNVGLRACDFLFFLSFENELTLSITKELANGFKRQPLYCRHVSNLIFPVIVCLYDRCFLVFVCLWVRNEIRNVDV